MKVPVHQKYTLTVTEASGYFGIGEKWLREYAKTHSGAALFIGNKWHIFREQLEEYLVALARHEDEEQAQIWGVY